MSQLRGLGSSTEVPIFIIGYPRSGSTLLERILDAHPSIAGLSEDSVMNGRMNTIRTRLGEAISSGQMVNLHKAILEEANLVSTSASSLICFMSGNPVTSSKMALHFLLSYLLG